MKKVFIELGIFLFIFLVFSVVYYFLNKTKIDHTKNYDFLIIILIGASSVFVVPFLQNFFKKGK